MSRELSWRAIADTLAARLQNHAFCETHPESEPAEECPFCRDRAAFRLWERKSGMTFVDRSPPGEAVDVFALLWASNHPDASEV